VIGRSFISASEGSEGAQTVSRFPVKRSHTKLMRAI
jgi:hypothetical protein